MVIGELRGSSPTIGIRMIIKMIKTMTTGDFVARRIVDRFNIKPVINSAAKLSVCSGLDNTCYDSFNWKSIYFIYSLIKIINT